MERRIGIPVICVLVLSACSATEPQALQNESISPTAKVEGVTTNKVGADFAAPLDVAFARLDQNISTGLWAEGYTDVNTALSATRGGGTDATGIRFDDPKYYQSSTINNETRMVGWYPAIIPSAGVLTFDSSDGATDVLLTQELTGNAEHKFGADKNLFIFGHKLSLILVSVIATSQETVNRWVSVASVSVKGLPTTYQITLPGDALATGTKDIVLNRRGGSGKMVAVELSSSCLVECGYLLTAPLGRALTLELVGGNGERRTIEAPLPDGEFFRPAIYKLSLNLDGERLTAGGLTAGDWEEEIHLDVEF